MRTPGMIGVLVVGAVAFTSCGGEQRTRPLEISPAQVYETGYTSPGFSFDPETETMVVGGMERTVSLWDYSRGKMLSKATICPVESVTCLLEYVDSTSIWVGQVGCVDDDMGEEVSPVVLLDSRLAVIQEFAPPEGFWIGLFAPVRDTALVICENDATGEISIWDAGSARELSRIRNPHGLSIRKYDLSPVSGLAAASDAGGIFVWEIATGKIIFKHSLPGVGKDIALHPSGSMIAVCTQQADRAFIFDAKNGKLCHELRVPKEFRVIS